MDNLRENGASEEEIAFMFADFDRLRSTRRVELNAMTSPQFIAVPRTQVERERRRQDRPRTRICLAEAYRLFTRNAKVQEVVEAAITEIDDDEDETEIPANLEKRVRDYLVKHPTVRWHEAVQKIAKRS